MDGPTYARWKDAFARESICVAAEQRPLYASRMERTPSVMVPRWHASRSRAVLGALARPVFRVLNRPSLAWIGRAAYDFALRANGIAINFPGRRGLTAAEEAFLGRIAPTLANGVVLDVGANSGSYAAELRRVAPDARILAFEPHPRTFEQLRARLEGCRVEMNQIALGEEEGAMELYDFADADGSTQASLSRASVGLYTNDVVAHPVAVKTLDGILAENRIDRVALLKVDTEGFDIKVLRGGRAAIDAKRIALIQFEFIAANVATRTTMRDFFDALPGYRISRLCLNGEELPLEYSVKRCEIPISQNLVARPLP